MDTKTNLQTTADLLNVSTEAFKGEKQKSHIKGYISFEELEGYCNQNIEAIQVGNKG